MKYYAFIDGEQQGPFDLDQLKEIGLRPTIYVWCKGMDDWQQALEVPEVCRLFRQHIAGLMHPSQTQEIAPAVVAPAPEAPSQQTPSPEDPQEKALEDVPLKFRGDVRKSGTTPGPPIDTTPDINQPPQFSLTLAILSMLLCFIPTGIAAVIFAYKAQRSWQLSAGEQGENQQQLRRNAHEYARQSKMWTGITVSLGLLFLGFFFSQNFK